ncbi:wings apart-like protein [Teladorsagia circumcincta]|uniref:Wings apart-like protein n=1 Tax=Teladorsagia circumcincta TaxID=45464 RepID=A0A2G9UG95_TELCI|nr:wings apart-like protein [Teladorsagia circumcincta]
MEQNEEQKKYATMVWEVFTSYIERMESIGRKIVFDLTKEQLTPSSLVLEALVFVLARCTDENLKTELLNLGILQWIVGKELCCTKLGQVPGFLPLCLSSYTFLAPKFAPEDKKFDLYVMMTSLCVNLVERCNSNRRKLIETTVKVHAENGEDTEHKALDALAILFTVHEAKARIIDEDLDKDLAFEEPVDEETNDTDEESRDDGRLDRGKLNEMNESEMLQAVQDAMSKASAHMEDSVVASYVALLIGCLLQQNEGNSKSITRPPVGVFPVSVSDVANNSAPP